MEVVAVHNARAAVAIAATTGVLGVGLLQLGVLCFHELGRIIDLVLGLSLCLVALATLLLAVVPADGSELQVISGVTFALISRGISFTVLAVALMLRPVVVPLSYRHRIAALALVFGLVVVALSGVLAILLAPSLLAVLDGGTLWLQLGNLVVAAILVLATCRAFIVARATRDAFMPRLALGLLLLCFSQLFTLRQPFGVADYVSFADVLQLGAYLVLFLSLITRFGDALVERASAEERLRISRDLHDGLAQDLSLLTVRLTQTYEASAGAAMAPGFSEKLGASRRLAHVAQVEARQAITALRARTMAWTELEETVEVFCEEAAQNYEIEIPLTIEGRATSVASDLANDVVRTLNETISNAVLHGRATRVDVVLTVLPGAESLRLTVSDNGHGFVPGGRPLGTGVGLRSLVERLERRGGSLRVDSTLSHGTVIRAEMPVQARG